MSAVSGSATAGPRAAVSTADATTSAAGPYVGLITRTLAFGLDAILVNLIGIAATALVTICLSVLNIPDEVRTAIGAVGAVLYVLWTAAYFVTFWSTTGQTPGSRALRIRVRPYVGDRLPVRRAIVRFIGLTLAAIPLLAGYLMILVDDRRRGLQDVLARTVVVEAPPVADKGKG